MSDRLSRILVSTRPLCTDGTMRETYRCSCMTVERPTDHLSNNTLNYAHVCLNTGFMLIILRQCCVLLAIIPMYRFTRFKKYTLVTDLLLI